MPLDAVPIRNVAILLFDDVEVLDFCGPFEVFSVTGQNDARKPFQVFTVAEKPTMIRARNGLRVVPDYTLAEAPPAELLVVPGGQGSGARCITPRFWRGSPRRGRQRVDLIGLHRCAIVGQGRLARRPESHDASRGADLLREVAPRTTIETGLRVVDNGRVITSAGVAAGIDMSLYVVVRCWGRPSPRRPLATWNTRGHARVGNGRVSLPANRPPADRDRQRESLPCCQIETAGIPRPSPSPSPIGEGNLKFT